MIGEESLRDSGPSCGATRLQVLGDDGLGCAIANHEVSEWLVVRVGDQPDGSRSRILWLAPTRLECAIRLPFPLSIHPEDLDWIFSLVDENDIEPVAIRF